MAATALERLEDFVASFENPEISAMAAIARVLEDLPDEASRLRVMRWAFGKYGEEFKRPLVAVAPPAVAAPGPFVATRPTIVTPPAIDFEQTAPTVPADFDRQVAELSDLFGDRPDGLRLAKPRQG